MIVSEALRPVLKNLFLFRDTCNVYVIRSGSEAVLIDFGNGDVLAQLDTIGVERVTDVLVTHHHRDQVQGLYKAVEAGIHIWVPHTEQELFGDVEAHWQAREIYMNYLMRQDRFSLLEPVRYDGTLQDYEIRQFGGHTFNVVPTPGHTIGSITLMTEIDGLPVAFTGDLIAGPGKVWSLSATQWSYNGAEGVAASITSLLDLSEREPGILLPSHGEPIIDAESAIDLLVGRLWELLQQRQENLRLFELREKPYEYVTPHLLAHRASFANSYVLLSNSGKALFIDFGYDFVTSLPAGSDRASRRPWLYSIPRLKKQFGVQKIDVVVPTHFHDDHVAGINLLRSVEGTQVWAADTFADVLEKPSRYDLPCLWYDPIKVDRRLPLETPFQWEEYTLSLYPLRGHTRYAVAIYFEVDGYRVLATGDQYQGNEGLEFNYVYANRFGAGDYIKSAELYQQLRPDVIITGHWKPQWVTAKYLKQIRDKGVELERLHNEILLENPHIGEEGFLARLAPYQITSHQGEKMEFQVDIFNPFPYAAEAQIQMIVPARWKVESGSASEGEVTQNSSGTMTVQLDPLTTHSLTFCVVSAPDARVRRARIAADISIGGQHFGQQAEALVTIIP